MIEYTNPARMVITENRNGFSLYYILDRGRTKLTGRRTREVCEQIRDELLNGARLLTISRKYRDQYQTPWNLKEVFGRR